jgi:hypothetical protein
MGYAGKRVDKGSSTKRALGVDNQEIFLYASLSVILLKSPFQQIFWGISFCGCSCMRQAVKYLQSQDTCSRNPAGSGSTESTMFNASLFATCRPGP